MDFDIKIELKRMCQNQEDEYNHIFDDWLRTINDNPNENIINLNYFNEYNVPDINVCEMLLTKALNKRVKFVRYFIPNHLANPNMNSGLHYVCYVTFQ